MPERSRILDVSERKTFRTIYEAINWCVGTDYKYWGRACWSSVRPTDGFRMWFTQLAKIEKGIYVPAVNDCLNIICCDGNYHVFDDLKQRSHEPLNQAKWKYDLIFSKEWGGDYSFRGVFIGDYVHSATNHHVSKRIATKVRLIGCPARKIELLDSVPEVDFDEEYIQKKDYSSFTGVRSLSDRKNMIPPNRYITREEPKPEIDYKKMFPIGCSVRHKTFGNGVVKMNDNTRITVLFEGDVEKTIGAEFCVEKKLIEKI